jgi:hypothetical protein
MTLRTSGRNNAGVHVVVVEAVDAEATDASAAKCHPISLKDF